MNPIEEVEHMIKQLIEDENVSGYRIQKDTGVSSSNFNAIRRGERDYKNLTFEVII
ncbi:hypothetical protein [Nosocomiicoccus sp. HMSC067E10]|nr:hypothetical protein [Nosocomiicoccus sp. HMSC067E10]